MFNNPEGSGFEVFASYLFILLRFVPVWQGSAGPHQAGTVLRLHWDVVGFPQVPEMPK